MKKCLPVSLVLLFGTLFNVINAQSGWVTQTNPLGSGESAMVGKVHFVSSDEGWISANGGRFLHTTDGGNSWAVVDPFPGDTVWNFSDPALDMCWTDQYHGWRLNILGSEFDSSRGAVLYKTTDGGLTWTKKYVSVKDAVVAAQIDFVDQNYGWIVLYDLSLMQRTISRTTDGGNTWNTVGSPTMQGAWLDFVDHNNGWLVTTSPTPPYEIQRTTNGGADWITQYAYYGTSLDSAGFDCVSFLDVDNGWVVGDNGKVLRTTNGGAQWNFAANSGVNTNEECKTVFFLDANTGWIPSKANDIDHTPYLQFTPDGGATWVTETTPFGDPQGSNAIFSIFFIDSHTGWITGDLGRIAKYTLPTSVEGQEEIPVEFALEQNYPNPFNPVTTIRYSSPERSIVTIKVYDVLGNEVAALVNGEKEAGEYTVTFEANGLASGIYVCRLQSGSHSDAKKMILMK